MKDLFLEILKSKVYDVCTHTPLEPAKQISSKLDNEIFIKREDLQKVFSFKLRGAYNKIANLSFSQKNKGIICASAGNHGQGVAYSGKVLGLKSIVVMPETTPIIKVDAIKKLGAKIILKGDNYSEASQHCHEIVKKQNLTYIHPFDDLQVIAGQGTIGKEILEDCPNVQYVFVPIGGGGLISGIATYIKSLLPGVKIIGVEPNDSDAMSLSIKSDKRVILDSVGIFADGVAVKQIGELTFQLVKKYVDDIITVNTDQICSAIKNIYEESRTIVEPSGALSFAGMKKYVEKMGLKKQKIVTINSGANMNFQRMHFIAERVLTGEKAEKLYAIKIPEQLGSLLTLCNKAIKGFDITEFNYRYNGTEDAYIFIGILCSDDSFEKNLIKHNFTYINLTDNEMAKQHVRHMVGGAINSNKEEKVFRFEFPERADALINFLIKLESKWNISLFHYRSYGSEFGKVLIGFHLVKNDYEEFLKNLNILPYQATDESDNDAYRLFLRPQ